MTSTALRLSEADVCQQIVSWLSWRGWMCIRTPATRVRFKGRSWWIFEEGHPDYICVRPVASGRVDFFYAELKSPDAKTKTTRKVKQTQFANEKTQQGYRCYRAPEDKSDRLAHFQEWYAGCFS